MSIGRAGILFLGILLGFKALSLPSAQALGHPAGYGTREVAASPANGTGVPPFKKVVLVIFENENIDKPLSQPFFAKLAKGGALLTNYHAVAHPSEPNYIALTSGDTQDIIDDANHDLPVQHLGDLLEAKSRTWKNYAEGYPGGCFPRAVSGRYARKHVPFISYTNVSRTARCANVVDAAQFAVDVKSGKLPDFSFYTPDMDDDVHDTNIAYGDAWFNKAFGPLIGSPAFRDVLLIVTFDENECNTVGPFVSQRKLNACKGDLNQVYTVFWGNGVKTGAVSSVRYDHYSLLRTLEAGFGLGSLGKHDDSAVPITDVWAAR